MPNESILVECKPDGFPFFFFKLLMSLMCQNEYDIPNDHSPFSYCYLIGMDVDRLRVINCARG